MKATKAVLWPAWLCLLTPWLFLILWIPPFAFWALFLPDTEFRFFVLEKGAPFCYILLLCALALNLATAARSSQNQNICELRTALLTLRMASIATYPALLWGLLLSILFLMGPERNKHIFLLLLLSFPLLNLAGAFYALPLISRLKKEQKISAAAAVGYTIAEFIIGPDIVAAFLLGQKCKPPLTECASISSRTSA